MKPIIVNPTEVVYIIKKSWFKTRLYVMVDDELKEVKEKK